MDSRRSRPGLDRAAAILVGVAYAAYASGTVPFTVAADITIAVPIVLVGALTVRWWSRWTTVPRAIPRGSWPWATLAVAVIVWEILSYLALPRAMHPTLSSLSNRAMELRAAKAAFIVVWLWIGGALVRPR